MEIPYGTEVAMPPAIQAVRSTGQLPVETTSFVGRRSELHALGTLLAGSRLVTVTGPGGIGKTRLALRAASKATVRYRDGVVLTELSGLHEPERLPHVVAGALGLAQHDPRPRIEAVTGYLRERELLLILDTCEHLVDECALFVEAVLREAPEVTILATSRQPLDVPGESTCPLGPLQVPGQGDEPVAGDAVELFAQRAAAAAADFEVTAANQAQVIRLCQKLDGIPLAIELAAVRLRALDLGELSQRLDHRLQVLAGGRRGTTFRHQALRDTIGWSYDLCTPAEQALWARLSVFAGPFSLQAAEETCADGDLPREEILGTLISLVDKSVAIKDDDQGFCYRLLDTIREYGAERLADTTDTDRFRVQMIRHYERLARELDASPLTGQLAKYRTLRVQHPSALAALDCAFTIPGQRLAVIQTIGSLYWYVMISGAFQEARHYITKALGLLPDPSPERASILLVNGLLTTIQGDPGTGLADCEEGLALARSLGESRVYARGHLYYCQALMAAGRTPEALAAGRTAARLMPEAGDAPTVEVLWLYTGVADLLSGEIDQCYAHCAEGLRRIPTDGGERWISSFLHALAGLTMSLRGENERAAAALREALAMRRELDDPMGIAYCLGGLGFVAARQGQYERSAWLTGAAAPVWRDLGTDAFAGMPALSALVAQAEADARRALGRDAWDEIFTAAATCPLATAVKLTVYDARLPATEVTRAPGTQAGAQGAQGATEAPAAGVTLTPGAGTAPGTTAPGTTALDETPLTSREQEIAGLVADGLSNREIANQLVISKRTVDSHVEHIFGKLGVSSRVQLMLWVRKHLGR